MIVKRDPKNMPVYADDILILTTDGETIVGETNADGEHLSSRTGGARWVEPHRIAAWAPAEWTDAPKTDAVERATIAEENANVALTHSVQLKRERDRAIEERDALGLQLAALRDQGERYAKALNECASVAQASSVAGNTDEGVHSIYLTCCAALTHGVDVTKEGE